ncbi:hypothetical protein N431DRAFT_464004 [Stipitochalara longipes BDJ]|nr:hypothetical protein N431DRAFT_464004 [Stipitochalara longipes BDJ]
MGATCGAGSWAIASPLKFYATIEKAKSPLFSEFDKFAGACGGLGISEIGEADGNRQTLYSYWDLEWDIEKVAQFLDSLIEKLSSSFRAGNASGSDMDESGCTMLHEILLLITILGSRCGSLTVQLHELLRLASLSGVDKFARSETFALGWEHTRGYVVWVNYTNMSSLTAMELLVGQIIFAFSSFSQQVEIPIYDTIKLFYLDDTVIWDKVFDHGDSYPHKNFAARSEDPLKFIMKHPEVIEQLECGELGAPILRRSIDGLRHAVVSPNCKKFLGRKYGTFHPLKLAVGWPIGVKILVEEKCFAMEAIELAICTNNIESLDIMLSDWSEHPVDWWSEDMLGDWSKTGTPLSYRMMLERASSCGSSGIHHCVVRHLNKSLRNFNELDFKCVKTRDKIGSAVSDEECSCCATPISSGPNNNILAYHFLDGWYGAGKLLDALYESGITAIDLKDRHQETPLLYRLSRYRDLELIPEAIIWFLEKALYATHFKPMDVNAIAHQVAVYLFVKP